MFSRRAVIGWGLGVLAGAAAAPSMGFAKADLSRLSDAQKVVLGKINASFDAIRTMDGKFIQEAPDGSQTTGTFVLSRPGRVLFKYDPPTQLEIRCDGRTVAVDDQLRQVQTFAFLTDTPLNYLLADRVDLTAADEVREVKVEPDLVTVKLEQAGTFTQGKLTLIFDAKTIELKQWIATDAQGLDTSVMLFDTRVGVPVDDSSFVIDSKKYNQK